MIDSNSSEKELLDSWYKRVRHNQLAHQFAVKRFEALHLWLGIPVIVLTTFVGTSVFASLQNEVDSWAKIVIGIISVLAAVFSGFQTFLRFNERAEKHKIASAKYGTVRRQIEYTYTLISKGSGINNIIESVKVELDKLALDSPGVPESSWKQAEVYINSDEKILRK